RRHRQQIHCRQLQKLSVRAVAADDAEHGSARTMTRITRAAKIAETATGVDLAYDALTAFIHTHEFMAERSLKPRIAARDFQISIANSGKRNAHQRFAIGDWPIDFSDRDFLLLVAQGCHKREAGGSSLEARKEKDTICKKLQTGTPFSELPASSL